LRFLGFLPRFFGCGRGLDVCNDGWPDRSVDGSVAG
jgi:hypothetical protein